MKQAHRNTGFVRVLGCASSREREAEPSSRAAPLPASLQHGMNVAQRGRCPQPGAFRMRTRAGTAPERDSANFSMAILTSASTGSTPLWVSRPRSYQFQLFHTSRVT